MGLVAASEGRADERYRTDCYIHLPGTSQVDEVAHPVRKDFGNRLRKSIPATSGLGSSIRI